MATAPDDTQSAPVPESHAVGSLRLATGAFLKLINNTRYRKTVILYRRADGAYLARYASDPPSRRDRLELVRRARAQRLFSELPNKLVAWDVAFPAPQFTDIRERHADAESAAD
jgi:hypothetical protein